MFEWSKKSPKPSHDIYSKQPKKEANKLRILENSLSNILEMSFDSLWIIDLK